MGIETFDEFQRGDIARLLGNRWGTAGEGIAGTQAFGDDPRERRREINGEGLYRCFGINMAGVNLSFIQDQEVRVIYRVGGIVGFIVFAAFVGAFYGKAAPMGG